MTKKRTIQTIILMLCIALPVSNLMARELLADGHFLIYFTVQNLNINSPGYGKEMK